MDGDLANTLIGGGINLAGSLLVVWLKSALSDRPATGSGNSALGVLLLALLGFVMGAVSSGLRDQLASVGYYYGSLTAEVVLVVTCLALAIGHATASRGALRYQLDVLVLWATFAATWLLFNGSFLWPFARQAAILYLACALIGGLIAVAAAPRRS